MHGSVAIRWGLVLGFVLLGAVGCSRSSANRQFDPTEDRLVKLGRAYLSATGRLGRPPVSFEEIKSDIEGGATEDFLLSPNDGEPFAILWGIDPNQLPPPGADSHTVFAYEKIGVGGQRWVLRFHLNVERMSDEAFRKCNFPTGHKPPP